MRSCLKPTNSCACCANGLSLIATHKIPATKIASRIQSTVRRLRGGAISRAGGTSTAAAPFGGELTGLPHFRQNCASSGRLAPHLLHPNRTLAGGGVALFVDILTGSPRFRRSAYLQGEKCQPILAQVWALGRCSREDGSASLHRTAIQPEFLRNRLQGFDAEADVFVQLHAQSCRAVDDVVAVHLAGEGFVFHPL